MNKKIAIVTGASRGIGKAVAAHLSAEFFVIGTATQESGVTQIDRSLGNKGSGKGYILNVADRTQIKQFVANVLADYGPPAVLVNNAGIAKDGLCMALKDDAWDDVLAVNLTGAFMLTRALLPAFLKARYGRIIMISSVVAAMGNPGQVNYAATKSAIEGFSRALAKEVAKRNITVNCVAPGFIQSDMTSSLREQQIQSIAQHIPMGILGTADDVAHAVDFLAKEASRYITGAIVPVNGGLYM